MLFYNYRTRKEEKATVSGNYKIKSYRMIAFIRGLYPERELSQRDMAEIVGELLDAQRVCWGNGGAVCLW